MIDDLEDVMDLYGGSPPAGVDHQGVFAVGHYGKTIEAGEDEDNRQSRARLKLLTTVE